MITGETRRKRGRPPKVGGPVSAKERKSAQRGRDYAHREEHPDRVVVESGLLWFETWVRAVSWLTELDGSKRKFVTEGYRRFGEAPSKTAYGLVSKLPQEHRGSATKVLESMGLLPKRTKELRHRGLPQPTAPNHVPQSKMGDEELDEMRARVADYADLSVTERIKDIDERAGATSTTAEGAGQSTYEPPRTGAATVSDAAHVLRDYGSELAVGPTASDSEMDAFAAWWEEYLRPYGGGVDLPAKIVRVTGEQAEEAKQRLTRTLEQHPSQASCPTCATSPLEIGRAHV
jgi:hypothetical protein